MTLPPELRALALTIFAGAIERPACERPTYLDHACGDNAELRAFVSQLVAADEGDCDFIETSVLDDILTTPMLDEGDVLQGRYRIVRLAGEGGMGEVYEAYDTLLKNNPERIAIKTLRRELTPQEGLEGFAKDIQLLHQISDPRICKGYQVEVTQHEGERLLFVTMEFLEGETLYQHLQDKGPLPAAEALVIAEDIALGLDAAHRKGVVHRDLKSSNIMLVPQPDRSKRAVIMDFGIAGHFRQAQLTAAGTCPYNAPETVRHAGFEPPIDIYAFGVVLYEMVTGQLPFAPDIDPAKRPRPQSTRNILGIVTGYRWDNIIRWCLERQPMLRPRRAADAVRSLYPPYLPVTLAACAVLLLVFLPAIGGFIRRQVRGPTNVVAILPFKSSGAPIGEGLLEYIFDQLQTTPSIRERWLIIPSRDLIQVGVVTARQAKATFGATHVISGEITSNEESIRIAGQLTTVDGALKGQFEKTCASDNDACVQHQMSRQVASVLDPSGGVRIPTDPITADALPYYLQGMYYLRRDSRSYEIASGFFHEAISRDRSSARPRIALAQTEVQRYVATEDRTALKAADAILAQVAATHDGLPELHAARGNLLRLRGQYDEAARELLRTLQADPTNHIVHRVLGMVHFERKRTQDAITAFEEAIRLQPRHWAGYLDYAAVRQRQGKYHTAVGLLEQMIGWAPDHAQGLSALGAVYIQVDRLDAAEAALRRSCELKPARTCFVNLGHLFMCKDEFNKALSFFEKALGYGEPNLPLLLNLADTHSALKNSSTAQAWYRKAAGRAVELLESKPGDSGARAILSYCKSHLGDQEGSLFELKQARATVPHVADVQSYSVLTYESLGLRDAAIQALREVTPAVFNELARCSRLPGLQQDPKYAEIEVQMKLKQEAEKE